MATTSLSTRDLSRLAPPKELRRLCQSLAVLDAILSPEWAYRYHSFNARWNSGGTLQMASVRDGEGDEYFCLFYPDGAAILKGFGHEAEMSPYNTDPPRVWPGVLDEVPTKFRTHFLEEPAFSIQDTTFCIWHRAEDRAWQCGAHITFPESDDPDGSAKLLAILDGQPETYRTWAEEYFEIPLPPGTVEHIYAHHPLTPEIVAAINPDLSLEDLLPDLEEIGYPVR